MNILELDSFNLADAVKFHDRLNPRLWGNNEHLHTDVRDKLLEIAKDFQEFLGVPDLDVKDITVSGSNAAYNYTPNSDIDLHLVIDLPEADHSEVYRELFDAKKFQYNAQHNIKIGGYDVELYVQNPNQEHHSQGIYSLLRNNWVSVPKRRKAEIDDISTRSKYEDLAARINDTVDSGNHESMAALMKKIKAMRQNSLDKHGELGADNLAFKLLRANGYIKKLIDARNAARDRELSLAELAKPKQRVTYGFSENYKSYFKVPEKPAEEPKEKVFRNANEYEWFKLQQKKQQPEKQPTKESPDGVDPTTKMFLEEPMDESPDGVNPTTAMFVTEDDNESIVREFIDFVADRLGITQMPEIVLHTDPEWSRENKSFGRYTPETHTLEVNLANRHVMDILRTTAHELVHCRQNQESQLPGEAGATGSRWENQAHAIAGVIMRDYAEHNPTMFESSGYIPTNAEKNDPRFKMALSVDVRPGQTGKEANKMSLQTDAQGKPALLMKSANLREGKMPQPSQGQGKYRDLNKPLGPETPPTMPAGTVKVDVSDVYDWYKLGSHISNLKGLGKHDFGAGPPSTIISFGDEDTEHKYIKDLEKTGLTTTDIDPVDPNQPKGMKRQKVDPTYNVNEAFDQPYPLTWEHGDNGTDALARLPDGTPLSIMFNYEYDHEGEPVIQVEFYRNNSQEVTGEGDAQRIFATVLSAIKQFISDKHPKQITFAADKEPGPSRADLYKKLVERFARPLGYQVDTYEAGTSLHFDLTRRFGLRESELAESLRQELELFEEQDLFEIKMTGKNLANLAKDIKGVKVGLEFEMIVPNVNDDEDVDQEPDYDYDERVRDIDDAINFFDDGDYNYGRLIRNVREEMESNYQEWVMEQIDGDWDDNGFEFFMEYMEREDPFLADEYEDRAEEETRNANPDLDPTSEEFQELKSERLRELESEYYTETWAAQGRSYDYAREEFDDEKRGDYSEQDWLESQGIRHASDVMNEYTDLTWPHWTTPGGDAEGDIKGVALNFMNAMGMNSVAIATSYHGSYEKWNGSDWVRIGSNKPDDCFTIEPDGSLEGNESDDAGLEFVSPPIPLEDVGTVMKKVQAWAADNGVYTGLENKTSMHTNISVPGYDLNKLDYLKAAILLGDEHVLREFERFGNSYAKPAIEKVKQLIRDKPEKAKELLDKMKSQLNAEASKLIHSGVTDKFTSINTKDNRIEFRSPGGDYLSTIAENPKKMQDTINRMVVAMDAAMDPNKYKEEYQKKLYKLLTGDIGSRKGKTGEQEWTVKSKANVWDKDTRQQRPAFSLKVDAKTAKDAWKALKSMLPPGAIESEYTITPNKIPTPGNKDLLKYFTQYAAGELPKAALKSFVRQAQLQRKLAKGEPQGKMWWNVKYNSQRMEVVADNESEAKTTAAREWGLAPGPTALNSMTAEPLRPYTAPPAGSEIERIERDAGVRQSGTTVAGRPNNPEGNWYLKNGDTNEVFYRFNASDYADAYNVLQQWKQENPDSNINAMYGRGRDESAQQSAPVPGSTLDLQRQRASQAQQNQGNWGIWINANDRFANQPGTYARGETPPLYRFPSQEAAEQWIEQQRAERPNMRTDIEVREIEPARQPVTDIDLFSEFNTTRGDLTPRGPGPWEIYRISDGSSVRELAHTNRAAAETEARTALGLRAEAPELYGVRTRQQAQNDAAQGGIVDVAGEQPTQAPRTLTTPGQGQQVWTGEWKVMVDGEEVYKFGGVGNNQGDANRVGRDWILQQIRQGTLSPGDGASIEVLPVMGPA